MWRRGTLDDDNDVDHFLWPADSVPNNQQLLTSQFSEKLFCGAGTAAAKIQPKRGGEKISQRKKASVRKWNFIVCSFSVLLSPVYIILLSILISDTYIAHIFHHAAI